MNDELKYLIERIQAYGYSEGRSMPDMNQEQFELWAEGEIQRIVIETWVNPILDAQTFVDKLNKQTIKTEIKQ